MGNRYSTRSTMWEIGTFCQFVPWRGCSSCPPTQPRLAQYSNYPWHYVFLSYLDYRVGLPLPERKKAQTCCLDMLPTASRRYTILAPSHRAHHCLRRPDSVACGAPRASAAKDRCTFLACGALFRTNESLEWAGGNDSTGPRVPGCVR